MVILSEKNLVIVSNAYPNLEKNFTQGIFIKNQMDAIKKEFKNIYVISPILRDLGLLEKSRKCENYSYDNIIVQYPKSIFIPKQYTKRLNIDFRLRKIEKLIKKIPEDIHLIHSHFGIIGKLISPLRTKLEIPLITSFYGYDAYQYIYDQKFYDELFTNFDVAIVLSNHMTNRLIELGCSPEKIKKIHIGIDLEKFKPIEKVVRNTENVEILIVANFVEKKGILNAILAYSELRKNNKNIHLTILGRGPLKESITKLITDLKINDFVSVLDNYSTKDPRKSVLEHMQKCDIFLLPSIRDKTGDCEGTPIVLMEASSCEKPCVTTEHSGNPEIILHNKTGFVIPENNIKELVNRLETLINDSKLRKEFGVNGRKHIELEFDKNKQSKKLIEIYKQLLR